MKKLKLGTALLALTTALLLVAPGAPGDVICQIEPSWPTYVPGSYVDFDVRLSGAIDLAAFHIEILVEDSTGSLPGGLADGHFWLVDLLADTGDPLDPDDLNIATRPDGASYLYDGNADETTRMSVEIGTGPPGDYGIALSDYDDGFVGRDTDPDKQILASFRVMTDASFWGTLRLTFDADVLQFDDPNGEGVAGFDRQAHASYEVLVPPIPEPAAIGILSLGSPLVLLARSRRRRGPAA